MIKKYSEEFKEQIISEYKQNEVGYKQLARKYNLSRDCVRGIIRTYKLYSDEEVEE